MADLFSQPPPSQKRTERPRTWQRRDQKLDVWNEIPMYFGALAWAVTLVAVMFASRSTPRRYAIDRFFGVSRSMRPDTHLLEVAVALLFVTLLLCAIGLAANSTRQRRAHDRYNRSLLSLGAFSLVGICACWWKLQ